MDDLQSLADLLTSGRILRRALADGSGVALDVKGLSSYSLNKSGWFLVEAMCLGVADADTLAAQLAAAFEVDEKTARADVADFIAALSKLMKP